jgi:hypothetical protein
LSNITGVDMAHANDQPAKPIPDAIRFHYIKSRHFRVIHVDGAYGGVSGRGYIHAAVYNERSPIPVITEAQVLDGSRLGKEEPIEVKRHAVREVEADLLFGPPIREGVQAVA